MQMFLSLPVVEVRNSLGQDVAGLASFLRLPKRVMTLSFAASVGAPQSLAADLLPGLRSVSVPIITASLPLTFLLSSFKRL